MIRYVHFEFRLAIIAAAAVAVTLTVVFAVHGFSVLPEYWGRVVAVIFGFAGLWVFLRASRIPVFSLALLFDEAVPRIDPYGIYPMRVRLFRRTTWAPSLVLFLGLVALVLPVSLLWRLDLIAGPLWLTADWTSKGLAATHWEYQHGVRLWQGHDRTHPDRFSYTPATPPPRTRTATGAPPG